jgi:phenylalanyl-tRNA synthetase beta subunit
VQKLCEAFNKNATFTQGLGELPVELYHPTRQFGLTFDSKPVGGIAEVHPRVMYKLGLEGKRVAVAEIIISELL